VVVTLALPVVGPEPTLWMILTDGLAIAGRADVLDVLDEVMLSLVADLALSHLT